MGVGLLGRGEPRRAEVEVSEALERDGLSEGIRHALVEL